MLYNNEHNFRARTKQRIKILTNFTRATFIRCLSVQGQRTTTPPTIKQIRRVE
jgi:hypothetical protein